MTLPDSVLKIATAQEFVGRTGKKKLNSASSTVGNLEIIQNMFETLRPNRSLEIGLAFAASATLFGELHRRANHRDRASHIAIDPFQSSVWDNVGRMNLKRHGLDNLVQIEENPSSIVLPELLIRGEKFDLIYVDGSHIFEDVFVDAYYALRLLNNGGVLLLDDAADPHVVKVIKFLERSLPHALLPLELSHLKARPLAYKIATKLRKTQCAAFKLIGDPARRWDSRFVDF